MDEFLEAIKEGDLATVKQMTQAKPDLIRKPMRPDESPSHRPMTVAAVNAQTEILAFLISEGGDVMEHSNFPLARAATRGGCVPTMDLLLQHGADVNRVCQDYGPPIIYAIEGTCLDSVVFLLDNNAKISGQGEGSDGLISWDALKHAGHFNRKCPELIPVLIDHGADVNSEIIDEKGGKTHNTALHNVAAKGDMRGVKILLEHGANPNTKNKDGKRPIDLTRNSKVRELLENLKINNA